MKKILFSAILASSLFAAANFQTGCGLGSVIIQNPNNAILYALQATFNSTSANQTFGISSGTLNCQKTELVSNEKALNFANANADALSNEIALGQGEYLDTLLALLDIQNNDEFKEKLRANYIAIYKDKNTQGANIVDAISIL